MTAAHVEFSVSTWQQPMPPAPGPARARVLAELVATIDALGDHRLRVAIDGLTAAGKTSLGHELARGLARPRPARAARIARRLQATVERTTPLRPDVR